MRSGCPLCLWREPELPRSGPTVDRHSGRPERPEQDLYRVGILGSAGDGNRGGGLRQAGGAVPAGQT